MTDEQVQPEGSETVAPVEGVAAPVVPATAAPVDGAPAEGAQPEPEVEQPGDSQE